VQHIQIPPPPCARRPPPPGLRPAPSPGVATAVVVSCRTRNGKNIAYVHVTLDGADEKVSKHSLSAPTARVRTRRSPQRSRDKRRDTRTLRVGPPFKRPRARVTRDGLVPAARRELTQAGVVCGIEEAVGAPAASCAALGGELTQPAPRRRCVPRPGTVKSRRVKSRRVKSSGSSQERCGGAEWAWSRERRAHRVVSSQSV
jgi:hypothetical protein